MARNVSGKASQEAVAPYQALPVQGPVITHHMTPALEVIEPGTASEEVGPPALLLGPCTRGPCREAPPLGSHKMAYQQPVQAPCCVCAAGPCRLTAVRPWPPRRQPISSQLVSHLGRRHPAAANNDSLKKVGRAASCWMSPVDLVRLSLF